MYTELCSLKFSGKKCSSSIVQNYISHLHLLGWSSAMSNSCGGRRRNRYFHGPLRFIARASCLLCIRIDFVWEEKIAFCRRTETRRGISLLSYQTRNPYPLIFTPFLFVSLYATFLSMRDTKVSQISDWRIASKIARRVNNRYVFASHGTSRGMSAFWMHPRVSHNNDRYC